MFGLLKLFSLQTSGKLPQRKNKLEPHQLANSRDERCGLIVSMLTLASFTEPSFIKPELTRQSRRRFVGCFTNSLASVRSAECNKLRNCIARVQKPHPTQRPHSCCYLATKLTSINFICFEPAAQWPKPSALQARSVPFQPGPLFS